MAVGRREGKRGQENRLRVVERGCDSWDTQTGKRGEVFRLVVTPQFTEEIKANSRGIS
ncbi:unnamed protein product [Sphenostylis stenocarpa]|uniref:Uncharacterized protein n=1 Tax=Sphenostylis stenocarpa TaxID=92480 RepID=A0AA86SW04_9FABA|nr:unnamed protein product [Sphenostylis stenocarpa]